MAAWTDDPAADGAALVAAAARLRWSAPELAVQFAARAADSGPASRSQAQSLLAVGLAGLGRAADAVEPGVSALRSAVAAGRVEEAMALRTALASCARALGDPLAGAEILRPAVTGRATAEVPQGTTGRAIAELAACLSHAAGRDDVEDALAEADRLLAADETLPATRRRVERAAVCAHTAAYHRRYGDTEAAADSAHEGMAILRHPAGPDPDSSAVRASLVYELTLALLDDGALDEALAACAALLAEPVRATSAPAVGRLRLAVATRVHLPAGRTDLGRTLLLDTIDTAQRHGLDSVLADAWTFLAHGEEDAARPVEALHALRSARVAEHRHHRATARARRLITAEFTPTRDPARAAALLHTVVHPTPAVQLPAQSRRAGAPHTPHPRRPATFDPGHLDPSHGNPARPDPSLPEAAYPDTGLPHPPESDLPRPQAPHGADRESTPPAEPGMSSPTEQPRSHPTDPGAPDAVEPPSRHPAEPAPWQSRLGGSGGLERHTPAPSAATGTGGAGASAGAGQDPAEAQGPAPPESTRLTDADSGRSRRAAGESGRSGYADSGLFGHPPAGDGQAGAAEPGGSRRRAVGDGPQSGDAEHGRSGLRAAAGSDEAGDAEPGRFRRRAMGGGGRFGAAEVGRPRRRAAEDVGQSGVAGGDRLGRWAEAGGDQPGHVEPARSPHRPDEGSGQPGDAEPGHPGRRAAEERQSGWGESGGSRWAGDHSRGEGGGATGSRFPVSADPFPTNPSAGREPPEQAATAESRHGPVDGAQSGAAGRAAEKESSLVGRHEAPETSVGRDPSASADTPDLRAEDPGFTLILVRVEPIGHPEAIDPEEPALPVGDDAMINTLASRVRDLAPTGTDLVRCDRGEFAVLLPRTPTVIAEQFAGIIRKQAARGSWLADVGGRPMTVRTAVANHAAAGVARGLDTLLHVARAILRGEQVETAPEPARPAREGAQRSRRDRRAESAPSDAHDVLSRFGITAAGGGRRRAPDDDLDPYLTVGAAVPPGAFGTRRPDPEPDEVPPVGPPPDEIPPVEPGPDQVPTPEPGGIPPAPGEPSEIPPVRPEPSEIPPVRPEPSEIPPVRPERSEGPQARPEETAIPSARPEWSAVPLARSESGEGRRARPDSGDVPAARSESGEGRRARPESGEGRRMRPESGDVPWGGSVSGGGRRARPEAGEGSRVRPEPDEAPRAGQEPGGVPRMRTGWGAAARPGEGPRLRSAPSETPAARPEADEGQPVQPEADATADQVEAGPTAASLLDRLSKLVSGESTPDEPTVDTPPTPRSDSAVIPRPTPAMAEWLRRAGRPLPDDDLRDEPDDAGAAEQRAAASSPEPAAACTALPTPAQPAAPAEPVDPPPASSGTGQAGPTPGAQPGGGQGEATDPGRPRRRERSSRDLANLLTEALAAFQSTQPASSSWSGEESERPSPLDAALAARRSIDPVQIEQAREGGRRRAPDDPSAAFGLRGDAVRHDAGPGDKPWAPGRRAARRAREETGPTWAADARAADPDSPPPGRTWSWRPDEGGRHRSSGWAPADIDGL